MNYSASKPSGPRPTGQPGATVRTWALKDALRLLLSALLEIFDESAYARFLERNCVLSSPSAYAAFLREHEVAKARRPRCC